MHSDSCQLRFRFILFSILGLAGSSCTSLRAPVAQPHFESGHAIVARSDIIDLKVTPVSGQAVYQQLFQENLPAIGIVVIWVSMRNDGSSVLDLAHSRWTYRRSGKEYRSLRISELFDRYYRARHIRAYTLNVDEKARLRAEKLLFSCSQLTPGMEHNGFIYFGIDPALGSSWADAGLISVQNIRETDGKKISIEVSLSDANP